MSELYLVNHDTDYFVNYNMSVLYLVNDDTGLLCQLWHVCTILTQWYHGTTLSIV